MPSPWSAAVTGPREGRAPSSRGASIGTSKSQRPNGRRGLRSAPAACGRAARELLHNRDLGFRFSKLNQRLRFARSVSSVIKCHHHRTKTKSSQRGAQSSGNRSEAFAPVTPMRSGKNSDNALVPGSIRLICTKLVRLMGAKSTKASRLPNQAHHQRHSSSASYFRCLILALIYVILTSSTSLKQVANAQASRTSAVAADLYWPLVQHRYQQLFFAARTHSNSDASVGENSSSNNNNNNNTNQGGDSAMIGIEQQASTSDLQHHQSAQRRLLNPLRHGQQQAAALAAAAAALKATANAALARKSQTHNLMIGQNFNNFSSIIPYSIAHDIDYGAMQEDQIINEPMSDMHESNYQDNQQHQQQHKLNQQLAFDQETKTSDSDISNEVRPGPQAAPFVEKAPHYVTKVSSTQAKSSASERALMSLDTNRLMLPQMQQIKARFNQGCVGGTKCQFFAFCWMSGGSLGASCGLLMTCCVTPSRQEIQPGFYGPVVNDPYCGRSTSKINRIVGGTDASFGQFPWQAFVQVGGSRCGGALISSRHVVTAGHCVARSQHSPSSIKITLGDYILNSDIESIPHEVYSVVEVLLHPNFRFTPQADRYDVAVLELDRAASYKDNIKPICLPQKDATFVGRVAYVAGWGALQAGSKLRPKVLQHVAVPVIENNVCESWHRRKGIDIRIYDEMMCAGYEMGQRDACQGDSGGPLMLNQFGVWYLVGIVSAGYSCAKQYQPGIYHRVSSSSDWISSNVYQQGNSK